MDKWEYLTLTNPTDTDLKNAGENGWEVYGTDLSTYKLKRKK